MPAPDSAAEAAARLAASDPLVARLLAGREFDVELGAGRRLRLRRPPEVRLGALVRGLEFEDVVACTVGWSGITEADLLGATVGSDAAIEWRPGRVAEVLGERSDWCGLAAVELMKRIAGHLDATKAARGN